MKLIFVIYDGIENSVFPSQVLAPILNRIDENKHIEVTLVSFERKSYSKNFIQKIIPDYERLDFVLLYKPKFLGKISLMFGVRPLKKLIEKIKPKQIIARGPLAGWVVLKVNYSNEHLMRGEQRSLIVQARGLLAEEFRLASRLSRFIKKILYRIYLNIEKEVYASGVEIESVSQALKGYLVETFGTDSSKFSIAEKDIPKPIDKKLVNIWGKQVREELNISSDAYVYCYCGSAHVWQCIDEMIEFFTEEIRKNPKAFFLVLSGSKEVLEKNFTEAKIDKRKYKIIKVSYSDVYKYMSASDAGLLFRKRDIVNWVSRPTKALEYRSVGLKIIHNNTVGLLAEK